ncbi:hypothetical protein [Paraflavitalea sp. CAU 1676]|uniref:hypothetical protein n=1 Tax=Paraflavitalea sp. CAU 1676 TaxID=3032598 RepID=UPI0023DB8532|nr:hypothetical protein [Paraflavitalea sp. CAU 1676]MDF2192613.1 hypothetical protein [Paraflavitalea sp. CAU 1676]
MSKHPFRVNNIDFYVELRQDSNRYQLQVFFSDGKPANPAIYSIKYEINDDIKLHTGSPGVQHLLQTVVDAVEAGFYEGSENFSSFIDPEKN